MAVHRVYHNVLVPLFEGIINEVIDAEGTDARTDDEFVYVIDVVISIEELGGCSSGGALPSGPRPVGDTPIDEVNTISDTGRHTGTRMAPRRGAIHVELPLIDASLGFGLHSNVLATETL